MIKRPTVPRVASTPVAPRCKDYMSEQGTVDTAAFARARLDWLDHSVQEATRRRRRQCGIGAREIDMPGPTAETKARLKPDQLLRLIRSGKLEPVHLAAADEIRDVFEALTRQISARALDLTRPSAARTRRTKYAHPIERMQENHRAAYVRKFRPWAQAISGTVWRRPSSGSAPAIAVRHFSVVIGIVVEGRSLGDLAAGLRLRRRQALEVIAGILRDSLDLYIEIAGWRPAETRLRRVRFNSGNVKPRTPQS